MPPAVWAPFLVSRALVWVTGVVAVLVGHQGSVLDPGGVAARLGHVGNIVAAPAVRWDAVWYVTIAQHGYAEPHLASFFPLYPLTIRALSVLTRSTAVAGIVISLAACLAALCVVHRLVELDHGPRLASATVWLVALFPMSLFLSAVYTESLFLLFSAGSIYAARRGRWAWAGLLGALAAATRSVGLLLVVPLVIIFLEDRRSSEGSGARSWRPGAWIALVPAGLLAYVVGLGVSRGTPLAMFDGRLAHRGFVVAPVTVVRQVNWTVDRIHESLAAGHHGFKLLYTGQPEIAFLVLALVGAVGVARRLPRAYAAYVIVALLVLLSEPVLDGQPLTSFPRYVFVLFPLWIWLAMVGSGRRWGRWALAASALLLALFTAQFATWHFVA